MRFLSSFIVLICFICSSAHADVSHYFDTIKTDPNALYAFLKAMPKGGELHYHLAGGAYPETMAALAAQNDYCLNKEILAINKTIEHCEGIKSSELMKQPELYKQIIHAWSMKNFVAGKESGHDHFFASFHKFMAIVFNFRPQLLAEIMQRAASQNENYLEIMIVPDNAQASNFAQTPISSTEEDFKVLQQQLLANSAFKENVAYTVAETDRILQQAKKYLGCDDKPQQQVCRLTVKFHYYVLREQTLEKVFAQALNGFLAASQSDNIVAVNLVQPEDGLLSLRDYRHQMQVFGFLHKAYPQVHISLHAGEITLGQVLPEDLRFHIHDAITVGQAERIGHGVDIAFEENAEALLKQMALKRIAVEINLTSNKKILAISGQAHPLPFYLKHKVPVVLSTDDEGVLRTDLTNEYVRAVLQYKLDYSTLKQINRNALTYSFLKGKSLWKDAARAIPVTACQDFRSYGCSEFYLDNEKAALQLQLEKQLAIFEKGFISH